MVLSKMRITKALIRLRGCAGWSAPVMFANPRRQVFSPPGPYFNEIVLNFRQVVKEEMSYKDISFLFLSSGSHFVQGSRTVCTIQGRGHHEEHFCEIILNLEQWCDLKIFLFNSSGSPFVREGNRLWRFSRGHYEVYFCDIIELTSGS